VGVCAATSSALDPKVQKAIAKHIRAALFATTPAQLHNFCSCQFEVITSMIYLEAILTSDEKSN
jgi:hypothetical protein